jgi:hypothetical protein
VPGSATLVVVRAARRFGLVLLFLGACGDDGGTPGDAGRDASRDSSTGSDASAPPDADAGADAGPDPDSGADAGPADVFPGPTWDRRMPAEAGLDEAALDAFRDRVGGRGVVVRGGALVYGWGDESQRGDIASAAKPIYAHLLFAALTSGRIASLDDRVEAVEPRLASINAALGFKDREITWRHLSTQTSCYGVSERPGAAFDYNDWQMALFFDALLLGVYGSSHATMDADVLDPVLCDAIECEDDPTLLAFGPDDRAGRVAISVRDFARFGLLYLREGRWRDRQLIPAELARTAVTTPLDNDVPRTAAEEAEMIPGQRSIGSRTVPDDQIDHLGSYSYLWWTNGVDRAGDRHWPSAPLDTFGAFGHGGPRACIVIPSLDLVVSWNDARVDTRAAEDEALALLVAAVR